MGIAIFWVLPEMAGSLGWANALLWITAGFALLWTVDRFVYPVCPACSHTHTHEHCATSLHGFAIPLMTAAALHSALDGWNAQMFSGISSPEAATLSAAFLTGIALHKIPEGLALGVIMRAAVNSRWAAIAWCAAAEAATLAGAVLEMVLAPHLSSHALEALLAAAGGTFLYLGGHAIHGELRRSGAGRALMPALAGVAGSSVLRWMASFPWLS